MSPPLPDEPSTGVTRISETALERRVKRWLLSGPFECYLPVAPGLEEILCAELVGLRLAPDRASLKTEYGGVGLRLDLEGIMRANLSLRTASRVLLRFGTVPASTPEMLYDRVRKLDWLVHLGFAAGFRLRLSSRRSKLQAGDQLSNTVASAIARHMREHGLYPKPDDDAPLEFHVRLLDDRCTISLDTSGAHLHRRGTRTHVHTAPLRETVAAAMALTALRGLGGPAGEGVGGVTGAPVDVIVDPFCGSGTLLIETTDVLTGAAPGRSRRFAFERAAWHRPGRWRQVQRDAVNARPPFAATPPGVADGDGAPRPLPRMFGLDLDPGALAAARANLAGAEYQHVRLEQTDSTEFDFTALDARAGLVIANAPFGVRLGNEQSAARLLTRFLDNLAGAAGRWRLCLLVHAAAPVVSHPGVADPTVLEVSAGGLTTYIVSGTTGRDSGTDA